VDILARKPALYFLKGAVDPDGDAMVFDQLIIPRLDECPATQGDDSWASTFDGANAAADCFRFDAAKFSLTASIEYCEDLLAFLLLDFGVEVDEIPAKVRCDRGSYC